MTQFEELAALNSERANKKLHTLYYPQSGGPLFIAARDGNPVQADTNATSNFGLHAIAAPEAIHIHRFVSGVSLWSLVNTSTLRRCAELNESHLAKWRDQISM